MARAPCGGEDGARRRPRSSHGRELRAEGSEPLSDDDVRLGVVITLDAPPEGWPAARGDLVWEFFDARRALSVELTTPGRYMLAWCFAPSGNEPPDAVGLKAVSSEPSAFSRPM